MRRATKADRDKIVDIIASTFELNPGVNWMIKQKGNHARMIRRMADYAFIKAFVRDGVYITSNEKGAALCYKYNVSKFSLAELWYELRFALTSIRLTRIPAVLKREAYRKKQRPPSGEFLYFWFLGITRGGGNAVFEIRDEIFDIARKENLPIYLETAMDRMRVGYERYGFETYHFWENKEEGIQFWFMRWEPDKNL